MKWTGLLPAMGLGLAAAALIEAASRLGWVAPNLLPAPSQVWAALRLNADILAMHTLQTLAETLLGLLLALILGLGCALTLRRSAGLRRTLLPWLVVSQTIPLIALAPLLLVWLGFGLLPKLVMVTLFCFFPITVSTLGGLMQPNPQLEDLFRSYGASASQRDALLRFPAALPAFFAGLRLSASYAVTAAIVGEYVGGYAGLGILIQTSANARATALVFAAIALTALFSVLLVGLVSLLERAALRGRPPLSDQS
ncbi:ABC transporter permease subunit [Deinococcus psychrotolerans]|uniref:ABC transporter permease subunit n=1 Tax=Deinococcus psychrotolerans TaxID=2489213 RepID=A0A3G8YDB9_9DEIO|nr:ABC transporter permease subunit [Deinococcus psychrotolerans]AZI43312.1 ABC transporter permease subunit [Deinococcus psychrotolerans]